jgi:hypothetical protein
VEGERMLPIPKALEGIIMDIFPCKFCVDIPKLILVRRENRNKERMEPLTSCFDIQYHQCGCMNEEKQVGQKLRMLFLLLLKRS